MNTQVMAPLGDVLYRGIVVEPDGAHSLGKGMVRIQFTPPIAIEPSGTIDYITCPAKDVTRGWF
jgi:hypothetical protein